MQDDKRKKKNKKKKNKQQNKTVEDLAEGSASVTSADENHSTMNEHGGTTKDTETAEVQDDPISAVGGDQESHFANESEIAALKDINRELQEERDRNLQKEASLLVQIKNLQIEKANHIHKEANLEEQVLQSQKDKDMFMQKEVRLEENIAELEHEKEVFLQKEAYLEEKVKQMEGEINSWLQKENLNKEAVDFLNGDISRLQMQVAKVEQLKDTLLQENQLMSQTISGLQMQILNLERTAALSSSTESKMLVVENGDATSELEAAHAQVERLITENADLVEKVNALQDKLRNNGVQKQENPADISSEKVESATVTVNSDSPLVTDVGEVETPENAPAANLSGTMTSSSNEITEIEEHDDQVAGEYREIGPNSSDMSEIDEIVQISLDENERHTADNILSVYNDEKIEIPISDAPLIGAPFRLISFMARYVSGADLIEKNSVSRGV